MKITRDVFKRERILYATGDQSASSLSCLHTIKNQITRIKTIF